MALRPVAQKVTYTSTAAGVTSAVRFGTGMSAATVLVTHASTKQIQWKIQGSIGESTGWFDLSAATSSTGSAAKHSTVTATFDAVRVNVADNTSTAGAVTTSFWIAARP